jgi:hypothetical protein
MAAAPASPQRRHIATSVRQLSPCKVQWEYSDMGLILLILVVLLLFGGGGFYGYRSGYYGGAHYGGGLGLIVLIVVLFLVFGGGGYWHY